MEKLKFSIIMPCYNSEKWIGRAIDSILNQTYNNFELIIIDDCSTDGSLEILKQYEKKDNRIKVLKNSINRGVSPSRNSGLEIAKGEWVSFLDSDDEYTPDLLEEVIENNYFNESDVAIFGYKMVYPDKNILIENEKTELIDSSTFISNFEKNFYKVILFSVCNKFFKNKIITENGVRFIKDFEISEDSLFSMTYFFYCDIFLFLKKCYYNYYTEHPNSLMEKFIPIKNYPIFEMKNSFFKIFSRVKDIKESEILASKYVSTMISSYFIKIINRDDSIKNKINLISEVKKIDGISEILINSRGLKSRKEFLAYIMSLKNSTIIYFIFKIYYSLVKIYKKL